MTGRGFDLRSRTAVAVAAAAALALTAGGLTAHAGNSGADPGLPRGSDPVTLNPADFSAQIDNRRWPMTVGSRWIYRVTDLSDGSTKRQVITVTPRTKLIADGIRARVVRDVVRDHGKPVEVTDDWYAQDSKGNVWYFGEHTISYEHGKPSDNGSWEAGVAGALPGIALPAKPRVGLSYREEYSKGVAEDQSRVLAVDAQAQARAGHYKQALLTEDYSPIEPDVSGGSDREELIKYTR